MIELIIIFLTAGFTYQLLDNINARYSLPLSFYILISAVGLYYGEKPKTLSEFIYVPFIEGFSAFKEKFVMSSVDTNDPFVSNFLGSSQDIYKTDPGFIVAMCDIFADNSKTRDATILKDRSRNFVNEYWNTISVRYMQMNFREFKSLTMDDLALNVDYQHMLSEPKNIDILVHACISDLLTTDIVR